MFSFIKGKQERAIAQKQLDLIRAYKKVFAGKDGEVVLKDLLGLCEVTFSNFDPDSNKMFFNEGKRFVGLHILSNIEATEAKIREIFRERYSAIEDMEGQYE